MNRFKLFVFYQAMAFVSLAKPKEGLDMIDAAEIGIQKISKDKTAKAIRDRSIRVKRTN